MRSGLPPNIDHLVYVTPDVDATVRELTTVLGVEAAAGGKHAAWGTRNALLSLGPRSYLEIMGPEPALSRPGLVHPFGIDTLRAGCLATWVAHADDLEAIVAAGRRAGVDLGGILSGSRARPDGSLLSWSMTDLTAYREGGVVPYFINWGQSPHPAASAPAGCVLLELTAVHPDPGRVRSVLGALGVELPVIQGPAFRLEALVQTKWGVVKLGSSEGGK